MFKGLILAALAAMSSLAVADSFPTVTPLLLPQGLVGKYQASCQAGGFNADDSVYGDCLYRQAGSCSGRGCQPVVTSFVYAVTWDLNGNATSATECAIIRRHAPQPLTTTYVNGYTDCPLYPSNPFASVLEVFYGDYTWQYNVYYYIATSADGVYALGSGGIVYPAVAPVLQGQ